MASTSSTRIIVKNLPKDIDENGLRNHFSYLQCTITDVKLARNTQGLSRRFAFIGFETAQESSKAISYFNNSYIGTIKIVVEPSSSTNTIKHLNNKPLQSSTVEKKRLKLLSVFSKEDEDDPELRSFLMAMKPRNKGKTWSNDNDDSIDNRILPKNIPTSTSTQSDDEYEEWDTKAISPMKSLKNKEIEEFNHGQKEALENQNQEMILQEETGKEQSFIGTGKITTDSIMESGRLFIRSLSYTCKSNDLEKLFSSFGPISEVFHC